jgi:hypothetical protein
MLERGSFDRICQKSEKMEGIMPFGGGGKGRQGESQEPYKGVRAGRKKKSGS